MRRAGNVDDIEGFIGAEHLIGICGGGRGGVTAVGGWRWWRWLARWRRRRDIILGARWCDLFRGEGWIRSETRWWRIGLETRHEAGEGDSGDDGCKIRHGLGGVLKNVSVSVGACNQVLGKDRKLANLGELIAFFKNLKPVRVHPIQQ